MNKKDIYIYAFIAIIILLIIVGIYSLKKNPNGIKEEIAKCIAEKSELYVQLGCSACKYQEDIFGDTYPYLNIIDCAYETEKCAEAQITGTPTWIINNQQIKGVQSIETLKQLTEC